MTEFNLEENIYLLEKDSDNVYYYDGETFFEKKNSNLIKLKTLSKNYKFFINLNNKLVMWKIDSIELDFVNISEIQLDENKKPIAKVERGFYTMSKSEYESELNELLEPEENTQGKISRPKKKLELEDGKTFLESFKELDTTEQYFFYFSLFVVFIIFMLFLNLPPFIRDINIFFDFILSIGVLAICSKKIFLMSIIICRRHKDKIESLIYKK